MSSAWCAWGEGTRHLLVRHAASSLWKHSKKGFFTSRLLCGSRVTWGSWFCLISYYLPCISCNGQWLNTINYTILLLHTLRVPKSWGSVIYGPIVRVASEPSIEKVQKKSKHSTSATAWPILSWCRNCLSRYRHNPEGPFPSMPPWRCPQSSLSTWTQQSMNPLHLLSTSPATWRGSRSLQHQRPSGQCYHHSSDGSMTCFQNPHTPSPSMVLKEYQSLEVNVIQSTPRWKTSSGKPMSVSDSNAFQRSEWNSWLQ